MRLFGRVTFVVAFLLTIITLPAAAQVSLTALGNPYSQNFDTLAASGTSSTVPAGWAFSESGTSANTTYSAGTGSGTAGDTYSFGSAALPADRAFGGLLSGALTPTIGAAFTNNTGATITSLSLSYTGEQWRLGATGRTDRLDFQYSTNATSLTTGTWTDVDTLDFNGPISTGTVGALDGNAAANRTAITNTIGSLSIANGATFWIRWNDFNAAGSDDGLAVDNFSLTPLGAGNTAPTIAPPANPIATVTRDAPPFTVNVSGSDDGGIYNWSATNGTGVSNVAVSGGQSTNTVTYTVTLTAGFTGTATFTATLTDNFNTPVNQAVNITVNPPAPPAAPTGLTATAGNAHVQLAWNAVSGATSYNVKRSTSTGTETTIASPGTNSYDDTTAVNGTTYFYVVSAVGAGGEGANSSEVSATPQAAPAAPTGLTATAGDSHVALSWTASAGAATYAVMRGTAPGGPYGTTFTGLGTTSYDDTSAVNGTTYYYVVNATNGFGTSSNSNEASATPVALVAPTGVTVQVGDSKAILNWNAVAGAGTYHVNRGTSPGGPYTTVGSPSATTFTDSTAVNGTTYYYVIAGFNGSEGPISSEVNATPNTPSVLGVVISQIYGGGGNAGATLKNDFVELFNRGNQTVSLNGWFVHYTSATGATWTAANSPTALSGAIAPGHYYLVQEGPGAGGTVNLPTPDASGTIAMGATGGKVALAGSSAPLSVTCPTGSFLADFVGYGAMATNFCYEGTGPTAATANTTAALRNNNGCTDTNNNAGDFTVGAPNPRNSSAPANNCNIINNPPTITAPADPIASVAQDSAPFTVNLTGSDDGGVYVWSATAGTGIQNVSVSAGQGSANVTYTVTLVAGFNGTATFTATLSDGINPAVNRTVHIQVTVVGGNNPPVITPPANPITTVAQDPPPFTVNVSGTDDGNVFNWSATPGTGVASVNVTGGQGTATVTYTVALNAGFNGTATFTASLSDNVNPLVNQLVNINVLSAGATPNHVVISQLYGGGGNSGATFTNDFIELFNPTASPVNLSGWSVQYSPATNTGAFTGLQPIGGTIGPGEYYLISLASGGAVGSALPTANVVNSSGFNMSGTTGKVALVNTGTPVPGPCSATAADTDVVDLVGYGSANCNEGGTNAPTPSNTTSDFRKNGGNTDTNVNGNDFITATPNPRRTTPIQEFGPAIVNTDPANNASSAPRDASMIVTFTELVDVDPGWFNINCSTTGLHNDATVVEGAPDTWVITPNVNFVAAEQCSVTIFKDSVHDRDTDDSIPGTDTLSANYTWTFTVATGTLPPYPFNVHLTMGNPSNATASLSNPNNFLMQKPEMSISYSRDLGRPNWVSWHLTDEWVGSLTRVDTFRPDPEVPPTWYRVLASDFFASGFDRGHMTPNADRDKETSIPINQATFLMSNMVAQAPGNNQGPWADLEGYLRTLLPADELYIVSGPAGTGGTGSNGGVTNTVANGHVTVPASTWKCALILPKASGDDIARLTASTRTLCVIMPNLDSIRNDDWHIYLKSVDQVEALSGYDLFSNVPAAIQNAIEAGVDGTNPPGTANQSTSTSEDVAKSITLDAASPAGTLTYTILTGPFHGTLTGSGANQTYTPAPNFNGSDTFTWRVNDGTNNSNTSTFTINISEVNDPPTASDDSKSATANNALTFASSDLTGNDSTGPADEAGQALTVTNVTSTASTHGNVTLASGQVTYTPDSGYAGPASFTYTVCDNGTTAGSLDAQCTNGTVNVTVTPQVTTHFSVTAPANVTSGTAFNITVTALDASNIAVTSYTGTVHFTSSSAGSLPADYTFVGGDSGSHSFSVTLTSTGAQSITATDGGITGSANTTVAPPPATHFSVTAPANVTSGAAFNVTVTALDASNATVPGYTGTIHFTSSSAGSLPADYTFIGGDSGSHTFSVTLTSTGAQSITATDGPLTGTANTTVAPPPATHFSVTAPANVTSEAAFNVTVTALDASNVIVPTYIGTVHFTSSSAGSLPADYTFVAGDNGAHTFSVTLTSTGAQSITATDGPITGTANTNVAPPPATHLSVSAPASVTTSTPFNITVTALAASNSIATGYSGTVHFTSSSAGTLPADYTFVAGDNGSHTFSVTLDSPGSQTITATDTATASINGSASTNVVCPPAPAPTANATNSGPACAGTTVDLFGTGNGSVFSWAGPGGFTSSQQNPTGITVAGTYTVTVSTPGPCGSSAQASTTVVFNPIPSATITASSMVCSVSAGNSASVPNAGAGATYLWSISNGSITGGAGTSSITYTAGSLGAVHLAVTVTTAAACSASSTADVAIAPRPTITLPATIDVACGTSSVNIPFTLTGTGPWTLLWSDGITQSGITSASSSRTVSVTGSMVLSAVVTDANCSNGSASVSINVSTAPVITTQPEGQIVEPSEKATFTVEASGADLHYQWFVKHANGTTKPVGTDSPSYTTTPEGNGMWFVIVTNACGSVTSDSVTAVTVSPRHHAS